MNPKLALVDTALSGVRMLDLFSGIGGFHKGFAQAGYKFDWVGFSEIDKYASAVYKHKFKEAEELGDITTIQPGRDLPDYIDILCGGFPCQAFSLAGKRKGFDDTRGTLFFEIARILRHYRDVGKPISCFVLENVKGLLSHDNGRTFATVYRVLNNLGYTIEFQLLNTRWWLPQNRERIYIVGYIGDGSGSKVFPFGEDGKRYNEKRFSGKATTERKWDLLNTKDWRRRSLLRGSEKIKIVGNTKSGGERSKIHSSEGISSTLTATDYKQAKQVMSIDKKGNKKNNQNFAATLCGGGNSGGNHSDMDLIKIGEATKKGYAEEKVGDSINLAVPNSKTRRGRVGKGEAQTLDTGMQQYTIQPVLTPNRAEKKQNGRRFKEDGEDMVTLTSQDQHGVKLESIQILDDYNSKIRKGGATPTLTQNCGSKARRNGVKVLYDKTRIRRLTPKECERLQGFPDNWTRKGVMDGKVVDMSDTQRYKQCGNAVTVDVVQAVAERICPLINKIMSN